MSACFISIKWPHIALFGKQTFYLCVRFEGEENLNLKLHFFEFFLLEWFLLKYFRLCYCLENF